MNRLHVVLDQLVATVPGGVGRYTEELGRALVTTAPTGWEVAGLVSATPDEVRAGIESRVPGLASLEQSSLARRELAAAWRTGLVGRWAHQRIHAPGPLAPLSRHDRLHDGGGIVVTFHDAVPWTHPATLTRHGASWHRAMADRARRFADIVVVPTFAVADELTRFVDFGDRVRVVGGAVSARLVPPPDIEEAVARLKLPERYLAAVGTLEPRKGLRDLIAALAEVPDVHLLIGGPAGWGDVDVESIALSAGVDPSRVRALGFLSDEDLALLLQRATVFVHASAAEGFGLPVLEAMAMGTPVVHTDVPAVVEVSDGAARVVAREPAEGLPSRLADAIRELLADGPAREALALAGRDRARAFSWTDSARAIWRLHEDLSR